MRTYEPNYEKPKEWSFKDFDWNSAVIGAIAAIILFWVL